MARRILIVDDNAINRQMLINTLSKDYDIIEATNGKEALVLMHRHYKVLSAVLLDIIMPEMDGYEVLRCVRDNVLLAQIPVIMVTGSEDEPSRVKALALGANDFILKPFNPDIVRHCLHNNIALRETASILNAIQKDKLTGLYNRETFFEKVRAMTRDQDPGTYILSCFDIDNFKLINDQYSAAEGDRILKKIGASVREGMNEIGGIAGRISADNFAALFPADQKDKSVLNGLHDKKISIFEQQPLVFSIGRYLISDLTLPASAIYDRAYIAKQSVKGRYDKHIAYFDEAMLERLVRDQQITSEMESALHSRQFEVWFQPQYNHATGALIGSEALARWHHPQRGIIPPGDFVPLFEQNGFVYELDKYVWREVCRYLRKWIDEKRSPLPVSINISRYDIFRTDLIEQLTGLVREYDIPIDLLHLEITESAFSKSTNLIVKIVRHLISLGFTIEIDDFGSGYSSLNTLKSVPAQVIKLDMRFLEDDDEAERGGNILESIVRMTKWLGMAVIAEGVETKEQGDFLKSIGCSHVQGYLYAKPMPAKEYEELCANTLCEAPHLTLETVENLDNDKFWSPRSIDTLIFNSYVGAACICEYYNGRIELLRATDKYARMLGGDAMTVDDVLKLDIMHHLDAASSEGTLNLIRSAAHDKSEVTGELLFIDLPGCPHETYLRSTMRVIASAGDRLLLYCISENITAQRVSERKERRMTKQLQVVMDSINCGITAAALGGETIEFLLANDKFFEILGYTRDQYRAEVGNLPLASVSFEDRERVEAVMKRAQSTGTPASLEYRVLRRDGNAIWIRSLVSTTTFEGIDGLVRICTYADVTAEKHAAQDLLDNLPCGAGLCTVDGDVVRMSHLNRRYYTYFKHSVSTPHVSNVYDVIHPEDRAILKKAIEAARKRNGEGSCVVRIADGPSAYILFRIAGISIESDESHSSIYVTFVPISEEELSFSEMLPMALETMMASSTDLSFIKDKNLKYICCSRTFAHMVGLESEKDVVGKSDYDLFDAALAGQYVSDDRRLMESGASIIDMVEDLPFDGSKSRFSSTSKYLLHDSNGNVLGIYGTGRDVTEAREIKSQLELLTNNIPGGIAVYEGDPETMNQIRLAYFSDAFCRLFGYTREEYEKLAGVNPLGLVFEEDFDVLMGQVRSLVKDDVPMDCVYRARINGGGYKWIHIKAVVGERRTGRMSVNAVLFDVTERQEASERLRVSEEENRLAIRHSGNAVCRYDVASMSLKVSPSVNPIFEAGDIICGVPHEQVRLGKVSPETASAYVAFYESILRGAPNATVVYQRLSTKGWRWIEARASTIFSSDGKPVSAVISFSDATESFEKDTAYKKWLQSLQNKEPESYSLFRCNISRDKIFDAAEGSLLKVRFGTESGLNERASAYASSCVLDADKERFNAFLNLDSLLERYYRGDRIISLEYRERASAEDYRWLRLTVDLVEYPHSADIEAYLLFENIDEAKRAELQTIERAETDPLTGVLNRMTFREKAEQLIRNGRRHARHALLMLDIDGFKLVNDVFGHAAGDQTLIELANLLRTILRRDDLVGRLGGDEFLIFLNDIPEERIAANKARQICELTRKTFSAEVQISGSVGIAVCPQDGSSFETLYKKADETLYHVKGNGRDNFAFYHADMHCEPFSYAPMDGCTVSGRDKKRRMLIVDDNALDNEMLSNIFADDFMIEKAKDGGSALIRLRHYGSAISVVLLDLMMPDMDGFSVLEKMQQSADMRGIPVIVVSGDDGRETGFKAVKAGAADFVTKPVDTDVLRNRVQSAISKAENERLRAKNSALEIVNSETARYRTVLDRIGLVVAELDWPTGAFTYGPTVSAHLAGRYDSRTLWHILLSDLVADAETVMRLQQLVHSVADDRDRMEAASTARLTAASGEKRRFRVNVYKIPDAFGLTGKIILTFSDLGAEEQQSRVG